jgi:hypothetical protein
MEATADAVDSGLLRFSSGSIIGTGGMVESPNQRINVRNVLPIITPMILPRSRCTSKAQERTSRSATSAG